MDRNLELLFSVLQTAIKDNVEFNRDFNSISKKEWQFLYAVSLKHDVCPLVSYGLEQLGFLNENNPYFENFNKETLKAHLRYENQNYDLNFLIEKLEDNKINFITLKGAELRKLYAKPFLRTSADIDILISAKDIKMVEELLVKSFEYKKLSENAHECTFVSPSGTNIEFHFSLIEEGWAKNANKILSNAFKNAKISSGYNYKMELNESAFYYYHLAHMAKHVETGGCGIRPFIDLYLMDEVFNNFEEINAILEKGGLLKFYKVVKAMCGVWFENNKRDNLLNEFEEFILTGGIFGSLENKAKIGGQKSGGKIKHILSKIFIPYSTLKYMFPVIQKHKWLTPLFEVVRWFKLLFDGNFKRRAKTLNLTANTSKEDLENTKQLFINIGL